MLFKVLFINLLTSIRIIGSILLIPIYHYYGPLYVGIVSFLCYVTDVLDGALARHFNASTFFGALFDGIADKLLTIVNFIVLYLITPYAIIPIIFEIGTVLLQLIKYNKHFNIKSNNIGKLKVWVLALTVVVTFVVSDISKLTILNENTIEYLSHISYSKLLIPAIIIECLTFISYLIDLLDIGNNKSKAEVIKEVEKHDLKTDNTKEHIKNIWLSPEFYNKYKDDSNLKDLRKETINKD